MKNILLIIDPQNDFITGTLTVSGAKQKMMKLSDYIEKKGELYDEIFITLDSHPKSHCSFKENGGIWPEHCVFGSNGWTVPEYLKHALINHKNWSFYKKSENPKKEEYSIFDAEIEGMNLTECLQSYFKQDSDTFIDVCGIAGDYCVLETIKGLVKIVPIDKISVLEEFTASIDGGEKIENYLKENDINYIYDSSLNLEKYVR